MYLEHLHLCGFFSSKLNFRFGNDKTFSNRPFPKSKVWIWAKILPKAAHFGQFLAQTVLWASFWTTSSPSKRAHLRSFLTGHARWAPSRGTAPRARLPPPPPHPLSRRELLSPVAGNSSRPLQGTPSSLTALCSLRPRQQLPRLASGTTDAAAGAGTAGMVLG
jgi:hypothetical protein